MALEQLLSVAECAAHLKVSHWTIRKWLVDGKLRATRAGVRILLSESELQRFLAESTNAPRQRRVHKPKPAAPAPGRRKPAKRVNGQAKAKHE